MKPRDPDERLLQDGPDATRAWVDGASPFDPVAAFEAAPDPDAFGRLISAMHGMGKTWIEVEAIADPIAVRHGYTKRDAYRRMKKGADDERANGINGYSGVTQGPKNKAAHDQTKLAKPGAWRDNLIDPQKLCDERFPEVKYVVPGIFPEGVTLLASRPKLGKSWLLLQVTTAVANGVVTLTATDSPAQGDVAYLALEDNPRRLQRRLTKYFGAQKETWPKRLALFTKWRRLDQGGLDDLREWCKSVARPTLIAIDTLKKVRPPKGKNQSDYDADYEACEGLMKLAEEFPGLSIIVSHHDRKMEAEDVFDTVSGTLGLTGGVDTIAVMKRSGLQVVLYVEGRDLVEPIEKAIAFDRETCRWHILGEAAEALRSDERSRVMEALRDAPREGLSVAEIKTAAELRSRDAADKLLQRMFKASEVERRGRGKYVLPGTPLSDLLTPLSEVSESAKQGQSTDKITRNATPDTSDTLDSTSDTTPLRGQPQ
jgi:AAA domain